MNERIKELRKQVEVDMHLHNIEDIKAMEGCFGFEGGNKVVNDYIEKFAELTVREVLDQVDEFSRLTKAYQKQGIDPEIDVTKEVLKNFGFTRFPRS